MTDDPSRPDGGAGTRDADPAEAPAGAVDCDNVNQRLKNDFGIVIRPVSQDLGCEDRIKVYTMFAAPFRYAKFERLVDVSDPFAIELRDGGPPGSCSGWVPNSQVIQIAGLKECLRVVNGPHDPDFARIAMFLTHETGHVISGRNPGVKAAFVQARIDDKDPRCYEQGFLKTYPLRSTNPTSESFAEGIALFIRNRASTSQGAIDNFRTECPHTYEWIRQNVYGAE